MPPLLRQPWPLFGLSIGADNVSFHFTGGRPVANVGNTSGSWFLFNLRHYMQF